MKKQETVSPISKLVDLHIVTGLVGGATQIHFRPVADGHLQVVYQKGPIFHHGDFIPVRLAAVFISRLKIAAGCRAGIKMRVQIGKARLAATYPLAREKPAKRYEVFFIPCELGEGAIVQFLSKK